MSADDHLRGRFVYRSQILSIERWGPLWRVVWRCGDEIHRVVSRHLTRSGAESMQEYLEGVHPEQFDSEGGRT